MNHANAATTRAAWNANAAFWDERMGRAGGGRPDLAQTGSKDASKLDEAMKAVAGLV